MEKKNIEIQFTYNGSFYSIDTGIKKELKENGIYYLADDYKNPTKIKFLEYEIMPSIGNSINIAPSFINIETEEIEYYNPKNVYKTAKKASEAYLNNKFKEV